jgi:hypothetical protein
MSLNRSLVGEAAGAPNRQFNCGVPESRNENRHSIFEARNQRVSPRRTTAGALEIMDIGSNSPRHRRVERTVSTVSYGLGLTLRNAAIRP